jgi:antitoxin ParD1/3/4
MKTTTVASGPHFDAFVQASILGGRYTNSSEVIQAGLRRLEEDEQRIAALRAAMASGTTPLKPGRKNRLPFIIGRFMPASRV